MEPKELVRSVKQHRMPVLLSDEEAYSLWLNPEKSERGLVEHLFAPADSALMVNRPAK